MIKSNKLFSLIIAFSFCLIYSIANAQQEDNIGVAISVSGQALAISASGSSRELSRRSAVFEGDTITTETDSYIQLRMVDSALITLRANTQFLFDEYTFDAATNSGNAAMQLLEGGFRTINGALDQGRYEIDTPSAFIGVRGTTHEAYIDPLDQTLYTAVYDGGTTISNTLGVLELGLGAAFDFSRTFAGQAPEGLLRIPAVLQQTNIGFLAQVNSSETGSIASAVAAVNTATQAINDGDADASQAFIVAAEESAAAASAFLEAVGVDSGTFLQDTAQELAAQLDENAMQTIATLLSTEESLFILSKLAQQINPQQNSAEIYQFKLDSLSPDQFSLLGGILNQGFSEIDGLIDDQGNIDLEQLLADPEQSETLLGLLDFTLALLPQGVAESGNLFDPDSGLPVLSPASMISALQSQLSTGEISSLVFPGTGLIISPLESAPTHRILILNARSQAGKESILTQLNSTIAPDVLASWGYWDQDTFLPGSSIFLPGGIKKGFVLAMIRASDPDEIAKLSGEYTYASEANSSLLTGTSTNGDLTAVDMAFSVDFQTGRVSNGQFTADVDQGLEQWQLNFSGQLNHGTAHFDHFTNTRVERAGISSDQITGSMGGVFTGTGNNPDFVSAFSLMDSTGSGISGLTVLHSQ